MKKTALAALLLAAALPLAAQADDTAYRYLDLGYLSTSYSDSSGLDNGNGYLVRGSFALPANLLLQGSYFHVNADFTFGGVSFTMEHANLGLGYRYTLTDSLDLVPSFAIAQERDSTSFASKNYSGYDLGLTLRGVITDQLEWKLRALHTSAGIGGNNANLLGAGIAYKFTPQFAGGAEYAHARNSGTNNSSLSINTFMLFARWMF